MLVYVEQARKTILECNASISRYLHTSILLKVVFNSCMKKRIWFILLSIDLYSCRIVICSWQMRLWWQLLTALYFSHIVVIRSCGSGPQYYCIWLSSVMLSCWWIYVVDWLSLVYPEEKCRILIS